MIVYCYGYDGDDGPVEKWVPSKRQAKMKISAACNGLRPGTRIWIDKVHLLDTLELQAFALACLNQQGFITQTERVFDTVVNEHWEVPA